MFDTDSDKGGDEQLLAKRMDIATALSHDGDPAEAGTILGHPLYVGDGYATLDPNFEGAMGAIFGDEWTRLYDEGASSVGESKPLRARYAAQRLADIHFAGGAGDRIDRLVRAVRGEQAHDGPHQDEPEGARQCEAADSHEHKPWIPDEPPF